MSLRVAILEDEPPARAALLAALRAADRDVHIVAVLDSVAEATRWLAAPSPVDLLFCDVRLSDGTAFDLFRDAPPPCPIVFATAYDAFALDAFRCAGIGYLLKPIGAEDVAQVLARYRTLLSPDRDVLQAALSREHPRRRILVRRGPEVRAVPVAEIAFLRADDKLTVLVDRTGHEWIVDRALSALQQDLDSDTFFRANRATLVHVDAVRGYRSAGKGRLVLTLSPRPPDDVIVSQETAAAFRRWLDR